MIDRVLVDSDVVLDVATERQPFFEASRLALSLIERGRPLGLLSSNSVTNIYYVLRRISSRKKALRFLHRLTTYLTVASVNHREIVTALDSDFSDFEDAVQAFCAETHGCRYLITRNIDDFKRSPVAAIPPAELIALYGKDA